VKNFINLSVTEVIRANILPLWWVPKYIQYKGMSGLSLLLNPSYKIALKKANFYKIFSRLADL